MVGALRLKIPPRSVLLPRSTFPSRSIVTPRSKGTTPRSVMIPGVLNPLPPSEERLGETGTTL